MLTFFRRIRKGLLNSGPTSKYLLYAIGEIGLVVIGILIALQINNWNEWRKERKTELEILMGIRSDLKMDLIDLNDNISSLQYLIALDSVVLDHLYLGKENDQTFTANLHRVGNADFGITLHRAHFEEAKRKGLSIITNADLRDQISRLYEFEYPLLIMLENDVQQFDRYHLLNDKISDYFQYQPEALSISSEAYQALLNDAKLLHRIKQASSSSNRLLTTMYVPKRDLVLQVIQAIEHELLDRNQIVSY